MWRMGRSSTRFSPHPRRVPCVRFFYFQSCSPVVTAFCFFFLNVAVAAGKVTWILGHGVAGVTHETGVGFGAAPSEDGKSDKEL